MAQRVVLFCVKSIWKEDIPIPKWLQYSTSLCMCKADQVNIKKGLGLAGKPKDPRWFVW